MNHPVGLEFSKGPDRKHLLSFPDMSESYHRPAIEIASDEAKEEVTAGTNLRDSGLRDFVDKHSKRKSN